jgi:HAD superfamily hydrolase (TIGR01459 family)
MQDNTVPPIISGLGALASRYDLILADVWGVVHNGIAAFPAATEALARARAAGATVILVSNAPRPGAVVARQIAGFGVPADCFDAVIASGDVAREELKQRPGARVHHLGPTRDLPNYEGLDLTLVGLEEAELFVCTGLIDDNNETPDIYQPVLARARARGLLMICANPDIVVERGDKLIWCAGALAKVYADMGGEVHYAGKPHAPIYDLTFKRAAELRGEAIVHDRALAIGDGLHTDLAGAAAQGVDCLFVAGGIHAADFGLSPDAAIDPTKLARMFAGAPVRPVAIISRLSW